MQIILNHDEFLILQTVNAGRETRHLMKSRSLKELRILSLLYKAGLIWATERFTIDEDRNVSTQIFGPINITPLGVTVLKEHSPWVIREDIIYYHNVGTLSVINYDTKEGFKQ